MGDPVTIGKWLAVAQQAKELADPKFDRMDTSLSRQALTAGGVSRPDSPNFAAMQQVGSAADAPRFAYVPFQDWFTPPPKRW